MISEEEYKKALEVAEQYEKENNIKSLRLIKPTDEQVYDMYIDFQWGLGAPELYFEGLEDGFMGAFSWIFKEEAKDDND